MPRTLRFCFDYVSPYAYLAWTQIHALAARHGCEVEPVPVLFAGLLQAHGTLGPAEIPAKRRYIFTDVARTARRLGIAIEPPPAHPFNPLVALRASALPLGSATRKALIDALFAAAWTGGGGIADPADVARHARAAGLDGDALVEQASSTDAKQRLRSNTDDAIAAGAFGVPTMLIEDQLFWGVDSLTNLDGFLGGELPLDPALLQRWDNLPSGATRKLPG